MAERRMFAKKIIEVDKFMELPASAQALYLHLNLASDDDGFCDQVTISIFRAHASTQDLQSLIDMGYVYRFESGVVVIRHWRASNTIRSDRYTRTIHIAEASMVFLDENAGIYYLVSDVPEGIEAPNIIDVKPAKKTSKKTTRQPSGNQSATTRQPSGNQSVPQVRVGKGRLGKDREDIDIDKGDIYTPPPTPRGEHQTVILTDDEYKSLVSRYGAEVVSEYIRRLDTHLSTGGHKTNHALVIEDWIIKDKPQPQSKPKGFNNFTERESDWDAITDRLKLMDT